MKILVLNSGSSSQKTALYEIQDRLPADPAAPLWQGKIEWDGAAEVQAKNVRGVARREELKVSRGEAVRLLLSWLWDGDARAIAAAREIDVVGHRVVLGGPKYKEPVFVDEDVKSAIANVSAFAPLHNDAEIEGIDIVADLMGTVPQVAVFDTGFHRNMPQAAAVYPGPYRWFESGIHRYGFHGINHQYCAERAARLMGRELAELRIVTCHLGNGCSLAAIHGGRSVDTTMGFTPLEGLMMGTRSGSVDPGILTYLMRRDRLEARRIDDMLNKESGLLGISGISADMREILSALKNGNARANLAFDIYVHRLRSGIGAMIAAIGGIDALVFTAGVGENSADVRERACANLGFAGVKLDAGANSQCKPDADIAASGSAVRVWVIRAQEDWQIAKECWKLRRGGD